MAKKIELNKKTLRVLSETEKKLVAGGWASNVGPFDTWDYCVDFTWGCNFETDMLCGYSDACDTWSQCNTGVNCLSDGCPPMTQENCV